MNKSLGPAPINKGVDRYVKTKTMGDKMGTGDGDGDLYDHDSSLYFPLLGFA